MKIRSFRVKNFGSIADVPLPDLGDLTILVGRNGAGKTFLLDALRLFFDEFDVIGGDSSVESYEYLWHWRNTDEPITIEVTFDLSNSESEKISEMLGLDDEITDKKISKNNLSLYISRMLRYGDGWYTDSLLFGNLEIIKDNGINSDLGILEPPDLSSWTLYLFDPVSSVNNITGARYLVNIDRDEAYNSDPNFDRLVNVFGLEVSEEIIGEDYQEWAASIELTIMGRIPNQEEAPELFKGMAYLDNKIHIPVINQEFSEYIQSVFRMIPCARDARENNEFRPSLIESIHSDEMRSISVSLNFSEQRKWDSFGTVAENFLAKRLVPNPEQILARDKGVLLPLAQLGGGEQSIMALGWWLFENHQVIAIEEPENHLHPEFEKQLFQYLHNKSTDSQIIITTHSPLFVDKNNPSANWLVNIDGRETKVSRCKDNEDLREVLFDLGVVPSDLLFRDLIIFVEGGTEKEAVFPIWANKLGLNITDNFSIGILSIGGDSRLKDNLRIWIEISEQSPIEYLVVVDSHAATIVNEIKNEMKIPDNKFKVLLEHSIEDYYPRKLVVEAIESLFEIEIDPNEITKKAGVSRANLIKDILEKNSKIEEGWKGAIGAYVAKRMKVSDIPDEFKILIKEIERLLGKKNN